LGKFRPWRRAPRSHPGRRSPPTGRRGCSQSLAVFRAVLDDIREIVVGLAGDVETVAAKQVLLEIDGKKRPAKFLGLEIGIEEGCLRRATRAESRLRSDS